jgi:threonylcarbamoyladenosine tRNA methylthiotransferase MtaB
VAGYHVENFGCRASTADGDAVAVALRAAGFAPAAAPVQASVIVLNTCAVTAQAERSARAYLRRVKQQNPTARILVTGCYAQRAPQELAALSGVDVVVGNSHKALVAELALRLERTAPPEAASFVGLDELRSAAGAAVFADDRFAHADLAAGELTASVQTRPNLKVQDGCANRCSFCIIPTTRGASRSQPLHTVLERVHAFAAAEGKELVLSGINLGRWGRGLDPPQRLEQLVRAILEQTALPRLRISSVEPMDWSEELLALYRIYGCEDAAITGPRLARHAHLPLQSGADAVLRAMHRRYRPWHYAEKLAAIRAAMPVAAVGADVMVGFPGETDALFEESYRFIAQQPFTYLHLFPFSARPGTAAWELSTRRPVPGQVVRERMERLRSLIARKQGAHRGLMRGQRLAVVTLKPAAEQQARGVTPALSDTFLPVEVEGTAAANQMLWVCVQNAQADGSALAARLIST